MDIDEINDIIDFKEIYKHSTGDVPSGVGNIRCCWGEDSSRKFNQCLYIGDQIITSDVIDYSTECRNNFILAKDSKKYERIIDKSGKVILETSMGLSFLNYKLPGDNYPSQTIVKLGSNDPHILRLGCLYKVIKSSDNYSLSKIECHLDGLSVTYPATSALKIAGNDINIMVTIPVGNKIYEAILSDLSDDKPVANFYFDKEDNGPIIGTLRLKNTVTNKELIYNTSTGEHIPEHPGKTVESKFSVTGYTYRFTLDEETGEKSAFCIMHDDRDIVFKNITEGIDVEDIVEDNEFHAYGIKSKDGKLYFIDGLELLECNDFRISGEPNDYPIASVRYNNIVYYKIGDKWRMKIINKAHSEVTEYIKIYPYEFDGVAYIGSKFNVIRKNGKEHFCTDYSGFEDAHFVGSGPDTDWYDECLPVNTDDKDDEETYMSRYAIENGKIINTLTRKEKQPLGNIYGYR